MRDLGEQIAKLTPRQREVWERLGRGERTSEIADALKLSHKTVECHREHLKTLLGIGGAGRLYAAAGAWRAAQDGLTEAERAELAVLRSRLAAVREAFPVTEEQR